MKISTHKSIIILAIGIAIISAGCTTQEGANHVDNATTATPAIHQEVFSPVKIALLQDKTPSTKWTGTPTFTLEDMDPLMTLLCLCGGEIAFGLISDESDKGLIRLMIDVPPVEPSAPSKEGNPFKVAEKHGTYQRNMEEFKSKFAVWQKRMEEGKSKFIADVDLLLKRNKAVKRTDVWSAVRRADLCLSEEDSIRDKKARKYAVLITDGLDNVRKGKMTVMRSGAKLLLVNASGSIGELEGLNPARFESITSAVRFIVTDAERGK